MKSYDYFRLRFNTIKYLTSTQIFYQVFYRVKRMLRCKTSLGVTQYPGISKTVSMVDSIPAAESLKGSKFTFLNIEHDFENQIDWNILNYGKLWAYNLNYFDYLNQRSITANEANAILSSFLENCKNLLEGTEPYPISVRGINWIKYFIANGIPDDRYNSLLYSHYRFLSRNLEFHLLGNHLLENGFSLLFASVYFNDPGFGKIANTILRRELKEQILDDGAHFELSPMYHNLILFRLLDCVNLLQNSNSPHSELKHFLEVKAAAMLGWIQAVSFSNGDCPMVNDSAFGIAPATSALVEYGRRLGIVARENRLHSSGYRMIRFADVELFVDVGHIGPDYIPGHAHSDTFNFVLYKKGVPFIVDTGTSTYESNERRRLERSTRSHNTVMLGDMEQSEVWGSFRVGERAKVIKLDEQDRSIHATHDGYKAEGVYHHRRWQWVDKKLEIKDLLPRSTKEATAYLHFHPDVEVKLREHAIHAGEITIRFEGARKIDLAAYEYATGFNQYKKATKAVIAFQNSLVTLLEL